jgi:hypothetical protein
MIQNSTIWTPAEAVRNSYTCDFRAACQVPIEAVKIAGKLTFDPQFVRIFHHTACPEATLPISATIIEANTTAVTVYMMQPLQISRQRIKVSKTSVKSTDQIIAADNPRERTKTLRSDPFFKGSV